jgi:calcineurin-like phosphoesterase family protein
MFRILHLSDLHFGDRCRFYDAAPEISARSAVDALYRDLVRHRTGPVHAVVLSGDFSWQNEEAEFEAAKYFCHDLAGRLRVPISDFILIPGNHDITWSEKAKTAKERIRYLLPEEAERPYRMFYRETTGSPLLTHLSYVRIFQADRIAIVGLNSCRFYQQENAGLGYVGLDQIYQAISTLRDDPVYQAHEGEFFKVAVLHHHLVPASDLQLITELEKEAGERHFSLTIDATEILRFLMKDNFALVLHGHMHVPFWGVEQRLPATYRSMPSKRIAVSGAGSFAVNAQHCAGNHFQVIEIGSGDVSASGYDADHAGKPFYQRIVRPIRLSRLQLTRPKLRLNFSDPELEEKLIAHSRVLMEEESALLARVLLLGDPLIKDRVFKTVLDNRGDYPELAKMSASALRPVFEAIIATWSRHPDPTRVFREKMKSAGVRFHHFLLDLMDVYVSIPRA